MQPARKSAAPLTTRQAAIATSGFLISLATRSYKGKKVGLDCANGSDWMMAKSVFDALGADTYVISNNPDGININVNCGSTHIEQMQKFVLDNKLDVGFAFDGDADRCLAVDEKGNMITGDHILYVCGEYIATAEYWREDHHNRYEQYGPV